MDGKQKVKLIASVVVLAIATLLILNNLGVFGSGPKISGTNGPATRADPADLPAADDPEWVDPSVIPVSPPSNSGPPPMSGRP